MQLYIDYISMKTTVQIILSCFIGLALWSCSSETDAYAKLVSEWQGREIVFPDIMTDVLTGDTIDLSDADFTILTYVDSMGCTGCRLKLPLWTKFIESLDSIAGAYEVLPIIAVNAKDDRELSYLIRRDAYCYPVIDDKADSLNRLNHFPELPIFRSLLLNRNKQVIAIDNPTTNNAVADLYRSLISGSKTFSVSRHQAITATPSRISLGEIHVGSDRSTEVSLENQGRDTVYIRDIITSCPCTEASVTDTAIPPGASVPVNVRLREDSVSGEFQRSVHIFYRDFNNPTVLGISGTIIQ